MAQQPPLSIEERVARLEGALGWRRFQVPLQNEMFWAALALSVIGLFCALQGLGLPNHYYQTVFAALTVALAYHQSWFAIPTKGIQWILAVLNTALLAILFKLVIGTGVSTPFAWLKLPTVGAAPAEGRFDVMPNWALTWQETALSTWSVDITIVQTFLLLVTLVGALFEFQPFASLTAFLLVVFSLPALVDFNWPWVFPAIILAAIALYLQTAESNLEE